MARPRNLNVLSISYLIHRHLLWFLIGAYLIAMVLPAPGLWMYVSVSSQADTESADLERERKELAANPEREHAELTAIYVRRGFDAELASKAA